MEARLTFRLFLWHPAIWRWAGVLIGIVLFVGAAVAASGTDVRAQDQRVALVIGVGAYQHAPKLPNPPNDAREMARMLESLGFAVTVEFDSDHAGLRRALQVFTRTAGSAETALIFFAGHGMESEGRNWLVPADARLERETDVEFETVSLDLLLRAVSGASDLRLVILDACRDNPLANRMRRLDGTRAIVRGLARVEPAGGTLVAYAARDGQAAFDGRGRNSPFTTALLAALAEPGLELGLLFRRVRDEVMQETSNQQEPFTYGSLPSRAIYLNPPREATQSVASAAAPITTASAVPAAGPCDAARIDWAAVSQTGSLAVLEEFRNAFSDCAVYARLADERIAALRPAASRNAQPVLAPPSVASPSVLGSAETEVALFSGATREASRNVQRLLNELGFDAGPQDGMIGARTRAAISAMQQYNRLPDNGYLDQTSYDALLRMHAEAPVSRDGQWSLMIARRAKSAYFRQNPQFRQPLDVDQALHTLIVSISDGFAVIERQYNGIPRNDARIGSMELSADGTLTIRGSVFTGLQGKSVITGTHRVSVPLRMVRGMPALRQSGGRIDEAFELVFVLRRL